MVKLQTALVYVAFYVVCLVAVGILLWASMGSVSADKTNGWKRDYSPVSGKCYEWKDINTKGTGHNLIFSEVPCD